MRPENKITRWREDPVLFVKEVLGATPDPWQAEALKAFPHNNRIAFKACKGPGKTATLAWLILNFLATRPHPKIACTSITKDNLDDNLWPEIAKWLNRSEFLKEMFEWTKTRIFAKHHPQTWFCSARTWPKHADATQQADTLAGLHADYLLFVLDESGGIPDAVMASAEAGLATGIETKLVQAGNPTHLEGPLYRACTSERDLWYLVEITGDPDNPQRSSRISKDWARQQIAKYGENNPWVLVNVFGKFPPGSINTLIGPEEVRDAMNRKMRQDAYSFSQKRLGIDVARFGDDATVIFPRQGLMALPCIEMRAARTDEIAHRVMMEKNSWGSEMEIIDSTGGFGAGVEDFMLQAGVAAVPIHFSGRATDDRYYNKRSEMWFKAAEWIKKGGCLPKDDTLLKELTSATYIYTPNGKLRLEEKGQIKTRLGFSPDRADAFVLTFAIDEMPREDPYNDRLPKKVEHVWDYDPFKDLT